MHICFGPINRRPRLSDKIIRLIEWMYYRPPKPTPSQVLYAKTMVAKIVGKESN